MKALLLILLLHAAPAGAVTRALFVGIDSYAHSVGKPGNSDPEFRDLAGAVNDVLLIKQALAGPRWRLGLDDFAPGGDCQKHNAVSVTLTNACASRANIIGAFRALTLASAPGDVLLFYYAGHGSQARDPLHSEVTGYNSTLLSQDARGDGVSDIIDDDIDRLITAATRRGVHVVTLFDACHSGSATRDLRGGEARKAPTAAEPMAAGDDIAPLPPPVPGAAPGYRVALAAADDNEVARETGSGPDRHGVFSQALFGALTELPAPAYADIAAEIRRRLVKNGDLQTPKAEGALTMPFLGLAPPGLRLFAASAGPTPDRIVLANGSLAGVTVGSTYQLFANTGAAVRGEGSLGTGTVESVTIGDAVIRLSAPLAGLPVLAQVREVEHVYGGSPVRVAIQGGSAADRAAVAAAIADATALSKGSVPDYVFVVDRGRVQLRAGDGSAIGSALDLADAAGIRENARKLAQYFTLLSLRNDRGMAAGSLALTYDCAPGSPSAPLSGHAGETIAYQGDLIAVTYRNTLAGSRHAYLVALGSDLAIAPLTMEPDPLAAGQSLRKRGLVAGDPGRNHFLLLLTEGEVDLSALAQSGARDMVPGNRLEAVLRAAARGQASRDIVRIGDWGAQIVSVNILPAAARRESPPCTFRLPGR